MMKRAMILTAGLGTRLRPITETYAKPAVSFLNVPLLYHALSLAKAAGVSELVMNTHYKPEQVAKLADGLRTEFKITLSEETERPLGSGGAIRKARSHLESGGDFLVINGDEVILPKASGCIDRLLKTHHSNKAIATLLVMEHPLAGRQFGAVWTDSTLSVLGFGKDRSRFSQTSTGYHYTGALVLNDRIFSYLPDGESNLLYDALSAAIRNGEHVRAHLERLTWYETGNPEDFLKATSSALKLLVEGGATDEDANTLKATLQKFSGDESIFEHRPDSLTLISKTAQIGAGVSFGGFVVIGPNAIVEAGTSLADCVILPGALIKKETRVRNEVRV